MTLRVARPVRRGKTGVVYFRKAVPKDLWTILGRREIKQSLRTPLAADARRRHADLHHFWEQRFEELRASGTHMVPDGYDPVFPPALMPTGPAFVLKQQGSIDLHAPAKDFYQPLAKEIVDPLALFDRMAREREFAPATVKRHRPIIEEVAAAHPDIGTITSDWCVAWKDKLIERKLSTRTVQYAYLAALRNLMGYALANKLVSHNPVTGISVKVKARKRNRVERGFTDAEARIVLRATMARFEDRLPEDQKRARRWLPWICKYSGARIGEPFVTKERTAEGFYTLKGGIDAAIARGIAYAPYADLIWCETSKPDLAEARKFAEAVRKVHPEQMLAYNCSPSFNWAKHMDEAAMASFQREIAAMGYKYQFITLAGFHNLSLTTFELARAYKADGMAGYSRLQQAEFAAEPHGFSAVRHQREVGTSYFDAVSLAVSEGKSATTAMGESTETAQFH